MLLPLLGISHTAIFYKTYLSFLRTVTYFDKAIFTPCTDTEAGASISLMQLYWCRFKNCCFYWNSSVFLLQVQLQLVFGTAVQLPLRKALSPLCDADLLLLVLQPGTQEFRLFLWALSYLRSLLLFVCLLFVCFTANLIYRWKKTNTLRYKAIGKKMRKLAFLKW